MSLKILLSLNAHRDVLMALNWFFISIFNNYFSIFFITLLLLG